MCERISAFNIPMSFNEVWTIVSNAKNASPIADNLNQHRSRMSFICQKCLFKTCTRFVYVNMVVVISSVRINV